MERVTPLGRLILLAFIINASISRVEAACGGRPPQYQAVGYLKDILTQGIYGQRYSRAKHFHSGINRRNNMTHTW